MSLGSLLGGAIGGAIGFFVGGPIGAAYGFGIGFGVGTMLDPMTPDSDVPGLPAQELQITSNKIGSPIFDCLGTVKISQTTLLLYGLERVEPIYTEQSGGKGGDPPKQHTGDNYYMSWAVGICLGPVDAVYTIFKDEKIIWSGKKERPSSGGVQTINISDFGTIRFYFGTDDQQPDSTVGNIIGASSMNSPLRGLCYAVMDDCLLGTFNRMPSMRFVVSKFPVLPFSSEETIQGYDYNPAHAIWYVLNKMVELSSAWLNSSQFSSIAESLAIESRGTSILFSSQSSALSMIEAINNHAMGILRYNSDGTFIPKLIRNDYDASALETIDEKMLLDDPTFSRESWVETLNEVKVQYSEIINAERFSGVTMILWSYYGWTGLDYYIGADTTKSKNSSDWTAYCNTLGQEPKCSDSPTHPVFDAPQDIAYSPLLNRWVAVRQGGSVLVSDNGRNWTKVTVANRDWEGVDWVTNSQGSGGFFVAVAWAYDSGVQKIMRSPDGYNWTYHYDASGGTSHFRPFGICHSNSGRLFTGWFESPSTVGGDVAIQYSSDYGETWHNPVDSNIPSSAIFRKFAYSPAWDMVMATCWSDKVGFSIDGGLHWTMLTIPKYGYTFGPTTADITWNPLIGRFFVSNTSGNTGPAPLYSIDATLTVHRHDDLGSVLTWNAFWRISAVPGERQILGVENERAFLFDFDSGDYFRIWDGSTTTYDGDDFETNTNLIVAGSIYNKNGGAP